MKTCVAALALISLAFATPTFAAETPADARYDALVAAAKRGEQVDWRAMRFAYAASPDFDVFGVRTQPLRQAMAQDFAAEDYAAALADARRITAIDFVDIDAHMISEFADRKLGRDAAATREAWTAMGLLQSIETGDGKSEATAFAVIAVAEEYSLMRALGLEVKSQALVQDGGHAYDVLQATDKSGATASYYFLIDRIQAAEKAATRR
jgi:hypothetical protein